MKKKISSKKIVAVLLALIMLVASLPMTLLNVAAAGVYDPAPYFTEDAINKGAKAWVDEDGNVQVAFPSAEAQDTFDGKPLKIAFYILELSNAGAINTTHNETLIKTIRVDAVDGATENYATFKASDIGTINTETHRYNVEITAVDEESWFSQSIHASLTKIPDAIIDPNVFADFSTSATAVREIMNFESDSDSVDDYTLQTGNQLIYGGVTTESGTPDITDNVGDTSALRFIMYEQPTTTQTFDTSWSRQTWDFDGAEEVWYWFDLEGVELEGLSFRLRAHEYVYEDWNNDSKFPLKNRRVSDIVYSTKGTATATYTGEAPYVYVQRGDGGWDKVMLNADGTIDVGNMIGYIRVPLKFMCSETDTYVDLSNQDLGQGHNFKNGLFDAYSIKREEILAYLPTLMFAPVLVDPAGTSISNALHLHRRIYRSYSGIANAGTEHLFVFNNANGIQHIKSDEVDDINNIDFSKVGYMLAANLNTPQTSVAVGGVSTDRAYVANGVIQNREGGLKSIQDICTAGFSIDGCSTESLKEDFYIDNIFFYRSDGGAYSENTLGDNPANTGDPMSKYFDEKLEISRIIFDEIDKYIESPDWTDYREVNYIEQLISEYKAAYANKEIGNSFLSNEALATTADSLNRDSWTKYEAASAACSAEGTLGHANADRSDLLPSLIRTLEKMPKANEVKGVSDVLRREIIKIWRAYSLLNLGQLDMLGDTEEADIVALINLLENFDGEGEEFVVGQMLADYPFITFNDFEQNYSVGDSGWKLENDNNAYSTSIKGGTGLVGNDWRHLKNLVTFSTNGSQNITTRGQYGYSATDADISDEVLDNKVLYDATHTEITKNGYLKSQGATVTVENTQTTSEQDGTFHTIAFTRHGKNNNSYTELEANNTGLDNLGEFSLRNVNSNEAKLPLGLVFYVDFSEISDFYFTANVFTKDEEGKALKLGTELGNELSWESTKQKNFVYYILDPVSGNWVKNHTDAVYCFKSNKLSDDWGDTLSLDNYKGYVCIPLYHIKSDDKSAGTLLDNTKAMLSHNSTWLNNIYAIQFCVGGMNADSLYGKSYTIDNVGFTYDPNVYDNASSHMSYAEEFDSISLSAQNFASYVHGNTITEYKLETVPLLDENGNQKTDEDGNLLTVEKYVGYDSEGIDIYDETTRAERIAKAREMYEKLPLYQQGNVSGAYTQLLEYIKIANGATSLTEPEYTVDELNTILANLPSEVTSAKVSGVGTDSAGEFSYDLLYPGYYVDENGDDQVNYSAYGLDEALADTIIGYYNNSYKYYSKAEKQVLDSVSLLNAYRAAMRTRQTLESIKSDVNNFLQDMTAVTVSVTDSAGNEQKGFLKIADRDSTVGPMYRDSYVPTSYYAKTSLIEYSGKKDFETLCADYQNINRGLVYYLKNTDKYDLDGDGVEEVEGGILVFQDKMEAIRDMVVQKITAKETFTESEMKRIEDILAEYNSLYPAYYNVYELYMLEQEILSYFPTAAFEQSAVTEVMLTSEKLTVTENAEIPVYKVTYAESLAYEGDSYFVRISANGIMKNALDETVPYSVSVNGTTVTLPYTETVTNNAYTVANPMEYAIVPTVAEGDKPNSLGGAVSDTIKVELVLKNSITSTETVVDEQLITVSYSNTMQYTVTIPADVQVDWDDTSAQDVSYSVEGSLGSSTLKVSVSGDGTNTLTNDNTSKKLTYTANNFGEATFTGNVASGTKPTKAPSITVSGWDNVPVGEYKTTLTYTVDVASS